MTRMLRPFFFFVVLHAFLSVSAQPLPCAVGGGVEIPTENYARGEVRFAAVGDTGRGCDEDDRQQCILSERITAVNRATKFDLFLLLGDNVYESGKPRDFFEKLYNPYRNLADLGVLIKGVIGNHDVRSDEGAAIQMKFLSSASVADQAKFFRLSIEDQEKLPAVGSTYHSFTRGNGFVEFFALDSSMLTDDCCGPFRGREYPAAEKQKQIDWLKSSLERSRARWKIVLLHHPLYSSAKEHGVKVRDDGTLKVPEDMAEIRSLEPILVNGGVQIVLSAHDHVYERIRPQKGIHHFVAGSGSELRANDLNRKMPEFHACGNSTENSFILFSITESRARFWAVAAGGKVIDFGEITRVRANTNP